MPRITKVDKVTQAMSAISGIAKRLTHRRTHIVSGKRLSAAQISAVYKAHLDSITQVDVARAAYAAAVAKERAAGKRVKVMTTQLKSAIQMEFGPDARVWADFGWELPKKTGPKTAAAKYEAVKKRAARRAAER